MSHCHHPPYDQVTSATLQLCPSIPALFSFESEAGSASFRDRKKEVFLPLARQITFEARQPDLCALNRCPFVASSDQAFLRGLSPCFCRHKHRDKPEVKRPYPSIPGSFSFVTGVATEVFLGAYPHLHLATIGDPERDLCVVKQQAFGLAFD